MSVLSSARETLADLIAPELRERRERLEREASSDALTNVANRRALDRALPAAERDPHTLVILFDADNFGLLNKSAGHVEGDRVLVQVARTIERAAGRFGYGVRVFRYGGDEFVVLASTASARRIRDEAEASFGVRGGVSLTGTVGRTLAEADARLRARKAARKEDS